MDNSYEFECPQFVDFDRIQHEDKDNIENFFSETCTKSANAKSLQVTSENCPANDNARPMKAVHILYQNLECTNAQREPVTKLQKKILSTEELELEKIAMFQKELAKKRKLAEGSLKQCKQGHHVAPLVVQPPTVPQEIKFATDDRLKQPACKRGRQSDGKVFARMLRSYSTSPKRLGQPKSTKVEPFHLSGSRKRKVDPAAGEKYRSVAEQVETFNKTPQRFRSRPANKSPPPAKKKRISAELTVPKTPNFVAPKRTRPITVKSQKEIEDEELEEMKKHQFKAHSVNEKIFRSEGTGVPKIAPKKTTIPVGFELENRKPATRSNNSHQEEEKYVFHAQPLNKNILKSVTGVNAVKGPALTVPASPAFALKNRLRSNSKDISQDDKLEEAERIVRANPVPHIGIPFAPVKQHKITEVKPFSFEKRDKERYAKKEKKILHIYEEEKQQQHEFHANPLPRLSPRLPSKKPVYITQPEPFNLEVDARGVMKAREWRQRIEEELKEQTTKSTFRAKSPKVLSQEPFLPKQSTKPLTDISDVHLHTEVRLERRHDWESRRHEMEVRLEETKKAQEYQRQQEEEREREKLRQEAVHKALPVRAYKRIEIKPSDKPLTEPVTPRFSNRIRSRTIQC